MSVIRDTHKIFSVKRFIIDNNDQASILFYFILSSWSLEQIPGNAGCEAGTLHHEHTYSHIHSYLRVLLRVLAHLKTGY